MNKIKKFDFPDDVEDGTLNLGTNQKVAITSHSISMQIAQLIDYSSFVNTDSTGYNNLQNDLIIYFERLLERRNEFNILNSYFDEENLKESKVISKLEKNIMIYLPVLVEYVYQNKEGKSPDEKIILIKETFKKLLILLFIYGDKTSLSLFSRLLKLDLETLKQREKLFIENQNILQENENQTRQSIISFGNKPTNIDDIYSRIYRSIIEKTDEKYRVNGGKERLEIREEVSKKEIETTFKALKKLYDKTIELNIDLHNRLLEISNAFVILNGLLDTLKKLGLISNSYFFKADNDIFMDFLNIYGDEKKLSLYIDNLPHKKNHSKDEISNISGLEKGKFDDLKIQNINATIWQTLSTKQKYLFFFDRVLCLEKGNFKIPSALKFGHPSIKSLVGSFCELYSYDTSNVFGKIELFKSKKSLKLIDLINFDLDKLIFLFEWYEFIVTNGNYKIPIKPQKPDILFDLLSKLYRKGDIDSIADIKTKGEFYNLSAVNIGLQIDFIFNDLSRGNLDISKFKIGKYLFKDITKFYSPGEKSSLQESLDYLNNAIDACISVLNGNQIKPSGGEYIKFLQEIEVLPSDLAKLKMLDKDRIIKLIPGLKLIKTRIGTLEKMQEIALQDMQDVSHIFSEIGLNNSSYDLRLGNSIGPEKDFGRIIIKLVKEYVGDFHKIGDLNRFRLIGKLDGNDEDSLYQILKGVANLKNNEIVENISFENAAGHLLSNPEKKSGYRDIKANILLKSGNLVEVQIHFEEMIGAKAGDVVVDSNIKDLLEYNNSLLTQDEVKQFTTIYFNIFGKYPSKALILNISTLNEAQLKGIKIGDGKINCDMLYKITRSLDNINPIKGKLIKLERIFFNSQWSKLIIKNLERIGLEVKEKELEVNGKSKK
ncbi:MAG: hypothetical protein PHH98_01880 [Candidatus Gracilibacteria bacterium]|nr:hypothetical protein [Candidatus Gracilibacteria bacterium]